MTLATRLSAYGRGRAVRGHLRPGMTSTLPLLLTLAAFGCAGESPATAGQSETLDVANAEVLPTIQHDTWASAPAGCEGRINEVGDFGVAEGEPELVVALDVNGTILCVDTYPALESELTDSSLSDEADRLWLGYLATLQNPELREAKGGQTMDTGWDPTPQPNLVAHQGGVNVMDDPGPPTNDGSDIMPPAPPEDATPDVDPTPQPNTPAHDGTGSETDSRGAATAAPVAPLAAPVGSLSS